MMHMERGSVDGEYCQHWGAGGATNFLVIRSELVHGKAAVLFVDTTAASQIAAQSQAQSRARRPSSLSSLSHEHTHSLSPTIIDLSPKQPPPRSRHSRHPLSLIQQHQQVSTAPHRIPHLSGRCERRAHSVYRELAISCDKVRREFVGDCGGTNEAACRTPLIASTSFASEYAPSSAR